MVYDYHGGIALAQRYWERTGWHPFAFYRFATWDGEMTLTFAMSGPGTVKLDDVSVRTVNPQSITPLFNRRRVSSSP